MPSIKKLLFVCRKFYEIYLDFLFLSEFVLHEKNISWNFNFLNLKYVCQQLARRAGNEESKLCVEYK